MLAKATELFVKDQFYEDAIQLCKLLIEFYKASSHKQKVQQYQVQLGNLERLLEQSVFISIKVFLIKFVDKRKE